jgi:hypothetical protein
MNLAIALRGAKFIVDLSLPSVTYDAWFSGNKQYFLDGNGGIQRVPAVNDNKVYTMNGLVNANNISGNNNNKKKGTTIELYYSLFL